MINLRDNTGGGDVGSIGRLATTVVGGVVGAFLGNWMVGAMLGGVVGNVLFPYQPSLPSTGVGNIGSTVDAVGGIEGGQSMDPASKGEVSDVASAGSVIPVVFGTRKIAGNFIYFNDFASHHHEEWEETPESTVWVDMEGGDQGALDNLWEDHANSTPDVPFWYQGGQYRFEGDQTHLQQGAFQPGFSMMTANYYTYTATYALALCRGPIHKLWKIYRAENLVATPELETDIPGTPTTFTLPGEEEEAYHQSDSEGSIYWGGADQPVPARVLELEGDQAPNYAYLCYLYFKDGDLGTSYVVPTLSAEVSYWPRGPGGLRSYEKIRTYEANPFYCVYDLLTNADYGLGLDPTLIDSQSFIDSAYNAFTRELGYSNILNDMRSALEWVNDILTECRGFISVRDGKFYAVALSEGSEIVQDILEEITWQDVVGGSLQFGRQAWDDVYDSISLQYIERDNQYSREMFTSFNPASVMVTDYRRTYVVAYPGLCNSEQASSVGADLMRRTTFPTATVSFKTTRKWSKLVPGDVIKFSYEPFNFVGIFHVVYIDEDDVDSNQITITLIQEPTEYEITAEWNPRNDWVPPTFNTQPSFFDYPYVVEYPQWLGQRDGGRSVGIFAGSTNAFTSGFQVYMSTDGGTSYERVGSSNNAYPGGIITQLAWDTGYVMDEDAEIGILPFTANAVPDLSELTRDEWIRGEQLGYNATTEEWFKVKSGYGSYAGYTLSGIIRAAAGENPDTSIWNIGDTLYVCDPYLMQLTDLGISDLDEVLFKIVPRGAYGPSNLSSVPGITVQLEGGYNKPLPVTNVQINNAGNRPYYSVGDDIVITWNQSTYENAGAGRQFAAWQIPGATLSAASLINDRFYLEIRSWDDSTLLRSYSGITNSYTYTDAMRSADGVTHFIIKVAQVYLDTYYSEYETVRVIPV